MTVNDAAKGPTSVEIQNRRPRPKQRREKAVLTENFQSTFLQVDL